MSALLKIGILLGVGTIIAFLFYTNLPESRMRMSPVSETMPAFQLLLPKPSSVLTGVLMIKGYVPKSWTFEGQFQVQVLSSGREILLSRSIPVPAPTSSEDELLLFTQSYGLPVSSGSGFLVFQNDNPSGLAENMKSYELPVEFSARAVGTAYLFDRQENVSDELCNVVTPRPVQLGLSKTPIRETLSRQLSEIDPRLTIKELSLRNGELVLVISEIPGLTSGGSCLQMSHRTRLEQSALQFPEVKHVTILPESVFQP